MPEKIQKTLICKHTGENVDGVFFARLESEDKKSILELQGVSQPLVNGHTYEMLLVEVEAVSDEVGHAS